MIKEKGILCANIAVEGDPSKGELAQTGIFVIFKINEDNSVKLLHLLSETDESGQLALPPKPADISEDRWQEILMIDYNDERTVNKK